MKISKREKFLLIILAVMLIMGCYYKFVHIPQGNLVKQLEGEKNQYEEKLMSIKTHTASIAKKQTDIKIVNAKIQNNTLRLFPDIKQENIIVDLDNILNNSSLEGYSIIFSDASEQSVDTNKSEQKKDIKNPLQDLVDQYNGVNTTGNNKSKATNNDNSKSKNTGTARKMTVNINYKGSYDKVVGFIRAIEEYSKTIIISKITIAQDATGGVSGTVTLDFYAIPKITDEDKDFFKWDYDNQYGKNNPFDGATTIATDVNNVREQSQFDFLMTVKPISSALPTVMLEKNKYLSNSNKDTGIYADNSGVEDVEIYFSGSGNSYYYKYKTSTDAFPKQFNGHGEQFIPAGENISLKVYSIKRNSLSDASGANIKIYNNTNKTVNVVVEGDDPNRPRVSIQKQGNVSVKTN